MPLLNSDLSLGDHIHIDKHTITRDVHVKVKLDVLGYDRGLRGNLKFFLGLVVDRYYQEVSRLPMFSLNFGSSIRRRDVRVSNSLLDEEKESMTSAQRALNFYSDPTSSIATISSEVGEGTSHRLDTESYLNPFHLIALLLSDSNNNIDWMGEPKDYLGDWDASNMDVDEDTFPEDPSFKLGIYNNQEDKTG